MIQIDAYFDDATNTVTYLVEDKENQASCPDRSCT